MIPTNLIAATDAMFKAFADYFPSRALTLLGYAPEIVYPLSADNMPKNSERVWVRLSLTTVDASPTSVGTADLSGKSRYTQYGNVFAQLFVPLSDPNGWTNGQQLAIYGRNCFVKAVSDNTVWFRKPRIRDLPDEPAWRRWNVVADFEYDELL